MSSNEEQYQQEAGVLISINPPYVKMIFDEFKPIEFRKAIIKTIKKGTKVYIYETKNKGGSGLVMGEAIIDHVFDYDIAHEPAEVIGCDNKFMERNEKGERVSCFEVIREIRFEEDDDDIVKVVSCDICLLEPYCRSHEILHKKFNSLDKKNKKEIDFNDYIKKIGFGGYYGIVLCNVCKYDTPQLLEAFYYKNKSIKRPPQNMMNVISKKGETGNGI